MGDRPQAELEGRQEFAALDRKIAEIYAFKATQDYGGQLAAEHERYRLAGTVLDPREARRYRLQYRAARLMREIIVRGRLLDGSEIKGYRYRVSLCGRRRTSEGMDRGVEVRRSPDGLRSDFRGVQTCGSGWYCPMCAPKIAGKRVKEVLHAMGKWQGRLLFITMTYHHSGESAGQGHLDEQWETFSKARGKLTGNGTYRKHLKRAGYKGGIRALEVTFGELNGWHVHSHEIGFFVGAGMSDRQLIRHVATMRRRWARVLIRLGMAGLSSTDTSMERRAKLRHVLARGFVVQHGGRAAEYILKYGKEIEGEWGPASELAKSHMKQGTGSRDGVPARCDHASPWQLLSDAEDGDERSGHLFREFGEAAHGRRQLRWSDDLKAFFGIAELEDDALAREPDTRCTEFVALLNDEQWTTVVRHRAHCVVKRIAAREGRDALIAFIESLQGAPPP